MALTTVLARGTDDADKAKKAGHMQTCVHIWRLSWPNVQQPAMLPCRLDHEI